MNKPCRRSADHPFWVVYRSQSKIMRPRSIESEEKAYVRFINKTDRTVELVWVNFIGEYMKYRILHKDEYVDVNTYKTHPWVALDHNTKDRLLIEKAFLYQPKTSKEILEERYPNVRIPDNYEARSRAYITLPLYSLKYRALLEIRNYLSVPEDADQLELPERLVHELKRSVKYRNFLRGLSAVNI